MHCNLQYTPVSTRLNRKSRAFQKWSIYFLFWKKKKKNFRVQFFLFSSRAMYNGWCSWKAHTANGSLNLQGNENCVNSGVQWERERESIAGGWDMWKTAKWMIMFGYFDFNCWFRPLAKCSTLRSFSNWSGSQAIASSTAARLNGSINGLLCKHTHTLNNGYELGFANKRTTYPVDNQVTK